MVDPFVRNLTLTGIWAEQNPRRCPCMGLGYACFNQLGEEWFLCPIHGSGVPHPDSFPPDDEYACLDFDYDRHVREMCVFYWKYVCFELGMTYLQLKQKILDEGYEPTTQDAWCEAANRVLDDCKRKIT